MESKTSQKLDLNRQVAQLSKEDTFWREELKKLRLNYETVLANLEKQQNLEKQYEASLARFRFIFEEWKSGNKIIAPDLRILQINKALQHLPGYHKSELVGCKLTDFDRRGREFIKKAGKYYICWPF